MKNKQLTQKELQLYLQQRKKKTAVIERMNKLLTLLEGEKKLRKNGVILRNLKENIRFPIQAM